MSKSGNIYFVLDEACGLVKIGFSTNHPWRRIVEARNFNPHPLQLLFGGGPDDELALHRRFHVDCVSGEWFKRSPKLDALIASRCAPVGLAFQPAITV